MKNLHSQIYVALFLISLMLVGAITITRIKDFSLNEKLSLINGQWASTFETYLNEQLAIKTMGVNVWAAIEYKVFGEGKKGVVIGREQWLFTDEEFYETTDAQINVYDNLAFIASVETQLKSQGVSLVVVLIPAKVDIYQQFIAHEKPSQFMLSHFDTIDERVADTIDSVVSLRGVFLDYKSSEDELLFLRTDTHWTPFGSELAAKAVAKNIQLKSFSYTQKPFTTHELSSRDYLGDLTSFIPLAPNFNSLMLKPDVLTLKETKAINEPQLADTDDLFGDEAVDFALVGTSYSENKNWNFEGALKEFMSTDIINYATEGEGPFMPMLTYLESSDYIDMPPQLVIWEIPVRYLTTSQTKFRHAQDNHIGSNLQ